MAVLSRKLRRIYLLIIQKVGDGERHRGLLVRGSPVINIASARLPRKLIPVFRKGGITLHHLYIRKSRNILKLILPLRVFEPLGNYGLRRISR